MTHQHDSVPWASVHDLRAHLVVAHSWPRWATVTEEGDDLRVMHVDMHILEETLEAKDEARLFDIAQLRTSILAVWSKSAFVRKLDSTDLKEAASLTAEHLLFGLPGWNLERIHRV